MARSLDAFVTKTITPLPREGNPPVRIVETDHGLLNSIGLQGPGIDRFVVEQLPSLTALELELWVSVGGFSATDFRIVCERLDAEPSVSTIELNLSCPNVDEAPEAAAELVAAARGVTGKPLYAKLSPAQWDLATAAKAVAAAGADGLSLVNTLRGLAVDPRTGAPVLARGLGGYSGPALRPVALAAVFTCANATGLPVVGMGGVSTGEHVHDLVSVGATAVALGTILFADLDAPTRVRREFTALLPARHRAVSTPPGIDSVV